MNHKYLIFSILVIFAIFGFNIFLIQRDAKLFKAKAYYACSKSYSTPDCPYSK